MPILRESVPIPMRSNAYRLEKIEVGDKTPKTPETPSDLGSMHTEIGNQFSRPTGKVEVAPLSRPPLPLAA